MQPPIECPMMKLGSGASSCSAQFHTTSASSTYLLKVLQLCCETRCLVHALLELVDVHALPVACAVPSQVKSHNFNIGSNEIGNEVARVSATVLAEAVHEHKARDGRGRGMDPHCKVVDVQVADVAARLHFEV
jgi:hypothetical protein